MGDVVQFPNEDTPQKPKEPVSPDPYETLIHSGDEAILVSKNHVAAGQLEFPYPSAAAVDPKYLKAVEEQRKNGRP
jgi:hypothetical protein